MTTPGTSTKASAPNTDAGTSGTSSNTEGYLTSFGNDGLSFDVIDSGPRDGKVVVLLHGFPQTAKSWNTVTDLLNQHGLRTIAPHQRGYSAQARPRGRLAYRIGHLIEDTERLIEGIDQPVHLVGHDWGAAVAWLTAAKRPDLVERLTTVSVPHPGAFLRSMFCSKQLLRSYYMGVFQLPLLPELLLRHWPSAADRILAAVGMNQSQRDNTRKDLIQTQALTGGVNWYRALPLTPLKTMRARVSVPTTHVWSDHDVALDRKGAELAGRYVDAPFSLVVLPGVSHWIPEHEPTRLAQIISTATTT